MFYCFSPLFQVIYIIMNLRLSEPVDVIAIFSREHDRLKPLRVKWKQKAYSIRKIDYVFREKRGRILFHVFSCLTDTLFFKLCFDTESLIWSVEEISDGEPD